MCQYTILFHYIFLLSKQKNRSGFNIFHMTSSFKFCSHQQMCLATEDLINAFKMINML